MHRRAFGTLFATALLLAGIPTTLTAQDVFKIGVSAPKTGPSAGGAAAVYWPNVQLWLRDVNSRGIKIGDQTLKVELVEYDDKSSPDEALKNIQRLATVDKVDFIAAPYTTGINLAAAPLLARYGYPQFVAAGTPS